MIPLRPLGSSGIDVTVLALGSWRTFEHIGFARAVEEAGAFAVVMEMVRE
mgnify:CR=1 FL=1